MSNENQRPAGHGQRTNARTFCIWLLSAAIVAGLGWLAFNRYSQHQAAAALRARGVEVVGSLVGGISTVTLNGDAINAEQDRRAIMRLLGELQGYWLNLVGVKVDPAFLRAINGHGGPRALKILTGEERARSSNVESLVFDLPEIPRYSDLKSFECEDASISEEAAQSLLRSVSLTQVILRRCELAPGVLIRLGELPRLVDLVLTNCDLPRDELDKLRTDRPHLRVDVSDLQSSS